MQRELEVLSEQYSQKCLENAHLAQALEAERQALRQCQRENQELNAHNQVSPQPGESPCSAGSHASTPEWLCLSADTSLRSDISQCVDRNSLQMVELWSSCHMNQLFIFGL